MSAATAVSARSSVAAEEFQALTEGGALHPRPAYGVLQLTGRDQVDFLQRMTTNDITRLQTGQATVTVLTSPVARIDAVFTVLRREESLLLLPAQGQAEALGARLQGQIFFMDKVTVTDESGRLGRLRLVGPQAAGLLQAAGLPHPAQDDSFAEVDFAGAEGVTVLRQERYDLPGYEIVGPQDGLEAITRRLIDAGALLLADEEAYEARRVALGRPRPGQELTDAYNPLEAGLAWACAEDKGCYTGQEIIARQLTYDKVTKSLVLLRSDEPLPEGASVHVPGEGRPAGTVTSSAISPQSGPVALAILRRPHSQPGSCVTVEGVAATVHPLPVPGQSVPGQSEGDQPETGE